MDSAAGESFLGAPGTSRERDDPQATPPAESPSGVEDPAHPQATPPGKQSRGRKGLASDRRAPPWLHSWQHGDPASAGPSAGGAAKAQRPRRASGPLLKKRFLSHRTRSANKAGHAAVSEQRSHMGIKGSIDADLAALLVELPLLLSGQRAQPQAGTQAAQAGGAQRPAPADAGGGSDVGGAGADVAGEGSDVAAEQEEILRLVRRCRALSAAELEAGCCEMVDEINGRRLRLPPGPLRQLYMRLLFILTRYTRFMQFSATHALPHHDPAPSPSPVGKGRRASGAPRSPPFRSTRGGSPLSSPPTATAEQARDASTSGSERWPACQPLDISGRVQSFEATSARQEGEDGEEEEEGEEGEAGGRRHWNARGALLRRRTMDTTDALAQMRVWDARNDRDAGSAGSTFFSSEQLLPPLAGVVEGEVWGGRGAGEGPLGERSLGSGARESREEEEEYEEEEDEEGEEEEEEEEEEDEEEGEREIDGEDQEDEEEDEGEEEGKGWGGEVRSDKGQQGQQGRQETAEEEGSGIQKSPDTNLPYPQPLLRTEDPQPHPFQSLVSQDEPPALPPCSQEGRGPVLEMREGPEDIPDAPFQGSSPARPVRPPWGLPRQHSAGGYLERQGMGAPGGAERDDSLAPDRGRAPLRPQFSRLRLGGTGGEPADPPAPAPSFSYSGGAAVPPSLAMVAPRLGVGLGAEADADGAISRALSSIPSLGVSRLSEESRSSSVGAFLDLPEGAHAAHPGGGVGGRGAQPQNLLPLKFGYRGHGAVGAGAGAGEERWKDAQVMCRLCERGVDVRMLPQHSQLCVLAHRCEGKGLSLDACLLCYASALGSLLEQLTQVQQQQQQQVGQTLLSSQHSVHSVHSMGEVEGLDSPRDSAEAAVAAVAAVAAGGVPGPPAAAPLDARMSLGKQVLMRHNSARMHPGASSSLPASPCSRSGSASPCSPLGGPSQGRGQCAAQGPQSPVQSQSSLPAQGREGREAPEVLGGGAGGAGGARRFVPPVLSLSLHNSPTCSSSPTSAASPRVPTSPRVQLQSPPTFGMSSLAAASAVLGALQQAYPSATPQHFAALTEELAAQLEELVDIAQCAADVSLDMGAATARELLHTDATDAHTLLEDARPAFLPIHIFGIRVHKAILEKLKRVAAAQEREEGLARDQRGGAGAAPFLSQEPQWRQGLGGQEQDQGSPLAPEVDGRRTGYSTPEGLFALGGPSPRYGRTASWGSTAGREAVSGHATPTPVALPGGGGGVAEKRTSIDDFEILKPISRGAYGRVFLVRKCATGDLFAIKALRKADMVRKNAVDGVLTERNILATVRSPFMVRCFYSFTSRNSLYLVMEYLDGGDLYSLLQGVGFLDEATSRFYIAELVVALEHLHSLGVVHRDIKPDNLLISHEGHLKLTDFGLSTTGLITSTAPLSPDGLPPGGAPEDPSELPSPLPSSIRSVFKDGPTSPDAHHTQPGASPRPGAPGAPAAGRDGAEEGGAQRTPAGGEPRAGSKGGVPGRGAAGTPDYLAPELLLGTGNHGPAVDWWAVGVVLFELLTGAPPFNAPTPEMIFDNILSRAIEWPPEDKGSVGEDDEQPALSPEAKDLINRLLDMDQFQRLGARGADEVKAHPFFASVNWETLANDEPPFVPATQDAHDTSYFFSRHASPAQAARDSPARSRASSRPGTGDPGHASAGLAGAAGAGSDAQGLPVRSRANSEDSGCDSEDDSDSWSAEGMEGPSDEIHSISNNNIHFANFSFKNLSQLAAINIDLLQNTSSAPGNQ